MASLKENVIRTIEGLTAMAEVIRSKCVELEDGTAIEEYPDKIDEVYDIGYFDGDSDGFNNGFDEGKLDEYDDFWDRYQNYGNLKNYLYTFSGISWQTENFKPKYDIVLTSSAVKTFYRCYVTNIKNSLLESGVTLTFETDDMEHMFYYARTRGLPAIQAQSSLKGAFYGCMFLETLDALVLNCNGYETTDFTDAFYGCSSLVNITIDGEIKAGGLSFGSSISLSKESITSVINALSSTTEGLSVSFSRFALDKAFGIDIDYVSTYTEEFVNLLNSKPNWSICW